MPIPSNSNRESLWMQGKDDGNVSLNRYVRELVTATIGVNRAEDLRSIRKELEKEREVDLGKRLQK